MRHPVLNADQRFQVGHLGNAQFFGALGADLGGIAVDGLPAAEDEIVSPDGPHGLTEDIAGGQGIAGGGAAISQEDRPVSAAKQTVAEHIGRLGGAHADHSDRSAVLAADFEGRFQGMEVFGVKNRRQRAAIDRSVLLHGLGRNIGRIRHLLDTNDTIVGHCSWLRNPSGR